MGHAVVGATHSITVNVPESTQERGSGFSSGCAEGDKAGSAALMGAWVLPQRQSKGMGYT